MITGLVKRSILLWNVQYFYATCNTLCNVQYFCATCNTSMKRAIILWTVQYFYATSTSKKHWNYPGRKRRLQHQLSKNMTCGRSSMRLVEQWKIGRGKPTWFIIMCFPSKTRCRCPSITFCIFSTPKKMAKCPRKSLKWWYPLVNKHGYWKLPFMVELPIKKCDPPSLVMLVYRRVNDLPHCCDSPSLWFPLCWNISLF